MNPNSDKPMMMPTAPTSMPMPMPMPMQMPGAQAVIVQQPGLQAVGPHATNMICPGCRSSIRTRTTHHATSKTHCWACFLCLCFCWPCVCLPYCCDSCRNTTHHCPKCNGFIGTYYTS